MHTVLAKGIHQVISFSPIHTGPPAQPARPPGAQEATRRDFLNFARFLGGDGAPVAHRGEGPPRRRPGGESLWRAELLYTPSVEKSVARQGPGMQKREGPALPF